MFPSLKPLSVLGILIYLFIILFPNIFADRGRDQEMYGLERLKQNSLEMGRSLNAKTLGQALKNHVQAYLNGHEFTDDFTLVILQVES